MLLSNSKFFKKTPLQSEPYGQKTSWLLLFARTFKSKFANTVVLDEASPQALPKYENSTRKDTNEKYLHKSNKNYKIHKFRVQTQIDHYMFSTSVVNAREILIRTPTY